MATGPGHGERREWGCAQLFGRGACMCGGPLGSDAHWWDRARHICSVYTAVQRATNRADCHCIQQPAPAAVEVRPPRCTSTLPSIPPAQL